MTENKNDNGLIIKSIGGLYTVESPLGIFECKARGIFRKREITPLVGDYVHFEDGVINEILPRKNSIIRPPLANLDQIIFVVSTCKPSPNFLLLDKFIAISRYKNISPIIAITKVDLAQLNKVNEIYSKTGIPVLTIDYEKENPIDEVIHILNGKVSAFTGNTGVGKSTLLNSIDSSLGIKTGEISEKLGRGRHTTRHAQLYKLEGGGYVADTPGFSTFETMQYDVIRKEELQDCFAEFDEYIGKCKFNDCSHTAEKGCAVIEAVKEEIISESRYNSYCQMYEEAKQIKEWEL